MLLPDLASVCQSLHTLTHGLSHRLVKIPGFPDFSREQQEAVRLRYLYDHSITTR